MAWTDVSNDVLMARIWKDMQGILRVKDGICITYSVVKKLADEGDASHQSAVSNFERYLDYHRYEHSQFSLEITNGSMFIKRLRKDPKFTGQKLDPLIKRVGPKTVSRDSS